MNKGRKVVVKDRAELANLLTKLEGKKSSIKVGDMREALRLLVELETALHVRGFKSAIQVLRREATENSKKILNGKSTMRGHKDVLSGV